MSALRNPRHEKFAQALVDGKSQIEAYALAGYRPSHSAPSRLVKDVGLCERVNELLAAREKMARDATERATAELALTKADVVRGLLRQHDAASAAGQHSAAIRALELLGKQLRMFVDRKELRVIRALADLTDEELDALLAGGGDSIDGADNAMH